MDEAEGYPEETVATTGDGSIASASGCGCGYFVLLARIQKKKQQHVLCRNFLVNQRKERERDGDWQRTADRSGMLRCSKCSKMFVSCSLCLSAGSFIRSVPSVEQSWQYR